MFDSCMAGSYMVDSYETHSYKVGIEMADPGVSLHIAW